MCVCVCVCVCSLVSCVCCVCVCVSITPTKSKNPSSHIVEFQDKKLKFSLNGNRIVTGTLRGYDAFLNVVLEEAQHEQEGSFLGTIVLRGSSIIRFEGMERTATTSS